MMWVTRCVANPINFVVAMVNTLKDFRMYNIILSYCPSLTNSYGSWILFLYRSTEIGGGNTLHGMSSIKLIVLCYTDIA
jgi:hypothetical protein